MTKGKKRKKTKKPQDKKKKVLKVGGLWIDSLRFPSLDDGKDDPPRPS